MDLPAAADRGGRVIGVAGGLLLAAAPVAGVVPDGSGVAGAGGLLQLAILVVNLLAGASMLVAVRSVIAAVEDTASAPVPP